MSVFVTVLIIRDLETGLIFVVVMTMSIFCRDTTLSYDPSLVKPTQGYTFMTIGEKITSPLTPHLG